MVHRPPCSGYHGNRGISAFPSNQIRELIRDFGPAAPLRGEQPCGPGRVCAEASTLTRTWGFWKAVGRTSETAGSARGRGQAGTRAKTDVCSPHSLCLASLPEGPAMTPARGLQGRGARRCPRALPVTPWLGALALRPLPVSYVRGRCPQPLQAVRRPHAARTRCSDEDFLP